MKMRIEKHVVQSLFGCSLLIGTVVLGGAGCGAPVESGEARNDEPVAVAGALTDNVILGEWADISGTVHVTLYRAPFVGYPAGEHHNTATCDVGPNEVVVGGGAETFENREGGALLTASYPQPPSRWVVKSKDHGYSWPHFTKAYCLGLRLDGMSVETLRTQMRYDNATSSASASASMLAENPTGYIMVGGGGHTSYGSGAGMLLTANFGGPDGPSPGQWSVSGKDHIYSSPGSVTAYAIGIKRCPDNWGACLVSSSTITPGSSGGGYQSASATVLSSWAMTSVGGQAPYNGAGRLLTDILPNTGDFGKGGVTVWSKDHHFADPNLTRANVIGIKRQ